MLNNFTLLYVEDNKEAQNHMKMMLEYDVLEFYQAYDGEEGLSCFYKYAPDIIITDINMPLLDGLSMAKKIKQQDKQQPIIVMSAFDDKESLLEAIDIGIDFFIPKPIDVEIINEKLENIASNLQNKLELEKLKNQKMKDLYQLAHYDTLTKIPNRFLFDIKLEEALSRAKREKQGIALLFIDLDDFKQINDTYGHGGGDKVLEELSKNIQNVVRKEDTFARISGDEFSLIIEDNGSKEYIDTFVKKILDASALQIHYQEKTIVMQCSIGISRYPLDSEVKNELIHFADIAMYKAKQSGKGKYAYYK